MGGWVGGGADGPMEGDVEKDKVGTVFFSVFFSRLVGLLVFWLRFSKPPPPLPIQARKIQFLKIRRKKTVAL